jgi:hypothetical protein
MSRADAPLSSELRAVTAAEDGSLAMTLAVDGEPERAVLLSAAEVAKIETALRERARGGRFEGRWSATEVVLRAPLRGKAERGDA